MRILSAVGSRAAVLALVIEALSIPVAPARNVYRPPANPRVEMTLDGGWRVLRHDQSGAQAPGFNDSAWTPVDLPHTWNNLDGENGPADGYYRGPAWYRKHLAVDSRGGGRQFFLKFEGAFLTADVWVNGTFIGEHKGGFAAFVFDVTSTLKAGADNVIAVKVNNAFDADVPPLNADFTFFGGLYRDVHLLATDPVQVSPLDSGSPGVYLKAYHVTPAHAGLEASVLVSNATPAAVMLRLRTIVVDAATNRVAVLTNDVTVPAQSISKVEAGAMISNPHLWEGRRDPYLYQTFTEVWRGTKLVDLVVQPLGFRSFRIDPTNGFFLNGHSYDLHGVNMHQDWQHLGWALTDAQRKTNFALLKEMGATAVRLSHYEHADETYELADRNGIVLWSEIPLVDYITESPAFYASAEQQLRELIRQRYNHPSVICWGLYNEITLKSGPSATTLITRLAGVEREEDPTRPSTAAAYGDANDPTAGLSAVVAINRYYGWYIPHLGGLGPELDKLHARQPSRALGVGEYGAGASVYQHTEDPKAPAHTSDRFHPEEWQNVVHEVNWQQIKARPYLWCKFIWNLADFAIDSRAEGDTPGRNDKGLVTYDRQIRKDAFYWYKANWTTEPMIYITGHTFTNRLTNNITAKVYANCRSVELFVNGASQGTQTSTNCIFSWPVLLRPEANTVRAVGKKDRQTVTDALTWNWNPTPSKPQ